MTDRRFLHANDRVAHSALDGVIASPRFTDGVLMRCGTPWADLRRAPEGPRDKQMVYGRAFRVLDIHDGWAFGFDVVDDYAGYVPADALVEHTPPTHRVSTPLSHVYSAPNIKSPELHSLSFFSELTVVSLTDDFARLADGGYVPKQHIAPLSWRAEDAAGIAELFLGVPYLWGGNTGAGIDCSGLVQCAVWAYGRACARDSDMQAKDWTEIPLDAEYKRGDVMCWRGHVGMLLDAETLIHANAHHMAVAIEPLKTATDRIKANEFGAVTTVRRP